MNQLPNAPQTLPLAEYLPASLRETRRHFLLLVFAFSAIALGALVAASVWPKQYRSSTTILVAEDNIIRQLMDGRAVPTSIYDRAGIAREVMFSRKVMDDILETGGWLDDRPSQAERERVSQEIQQRTTVGAPRENLIRIEYQDQDAERARVVVERFAALFMAESAEAKRRESREAYEFIGRQVREYHAVLVDAEQQLKSFRDASGDARPGTADQVDMRVADLRSDIERMRIERAELRSRQVSLESQLEGLDSETGLQTYQGQLRQRIAMVRQELDTLLLELQPRHPDVVQARYRLDDLNAELQASENHAEAPIDGSGFQQSLVQQEISTSVSELRSTVAGLDSRIAATQRLLDSEVERSQRVAESDLQHAELIRDHDVNRTIYEDLLNRLENARLSMRLDEMGRGLTFSIQEPATEAARPSGPRFLHMAAGGLVAAAAMPLGILLLLVRIDPRVRSPEAIERSAQLPLLGTVPRYVTPRERQRIKTRIAIAILMITITLTAYGIAGWLRLTVNT
jgi:polysaccharide chain length determinant protein (PEP-CTERM system associated)